MPNHIWISQADGTLTFTSSLTQIKEERIIKSELTFTHRSLVFSHPLLSLVLIAGLSRHSPSIISGGNIEVVPMEKLRVAKARFTIAISLSSHRRNPDLSELITSSHLTTLTLVKKSRPKTSPEFGILWENSSSGNDASRWTRMRRDHDQDWLTSVRFIVQINKAETRPIIAKFFWI